MARARRIALLVVPLLGVFLVWRARSAGDAAAPSFASRTQLSSDRPLGPVAGPDAAPELLQEAEAAARLPVGSTPGQDERAPDATADLRIRVVDGAGAPLAGARVTLVPAEFPYLFRLAEDDPWQDKRARPRGRTDVGGLLVLEDLPVRGIKVFVDLQAHCGSTPEERQLHAGANEIEVVLQRPGSLEVAVVRADGTPVPGVEVQATGWIWARSDAAGVARFAELPPGRYEPRARGLVQRSTERVEVRARAAARISLVVLDGGWIEGVLRDARGAAPREVWVVDAVAGLVDETEDLTAHAVQPGARYRLGPLVPGRYRVVAQRGDLRFWRSAPVHGSPEVEVRAGEVTECPVVLAPVAPTTLTGTVVPPRVAGSAPEIVVRARAVDGPPIGDLDGPRTTARGGAFELELPRPGTWMVTPAWAAPDGIPRLGEAVLCEVGEAGGHVTVRFGEYHVSGTVEPAGPFGIWAFDGSTGPRCVLPATVATASGSWSVELEHPGPWWFVASGSGFWSGRSGDPSARDVGTPVRVELTEDEPTRDDVALRATGADGPFAALDVTVFDREGLLVEGGFQLRVRDGEVDLPLGLAGALEPREGTWLLRAVRGDDCSAEVALDPRSNAAVRLDLRPGAFLRVETTRGGRPAASRIRLLDAEGRMILACPSRGFFAALSGHANAPHRRSFGPLPVGRYQVEATSLRGVRKLVSLELLKGSNAHGVHFD